MTLRVQLVAAVLLVSAACSSSGPDTSTDGAWVGTITTEGDVTTVINESGSVWGGEARLVVEATIGSEGSSEESLLGQVRDLATDGERILVADSQAVVVRLYDLGGRHLMDLGGRGGGPGEFREAKGVGVADDGRILVQDDRGRKIHVFDADGTYLESWDRQSGSAFYDGRFTVTPEGPFILQTLNREAPRDEQELGMVLYGPGGPTGTVIETETPRLVAVEDRYVRYDVEGGGSGVAPVPFVPQSHWMMAGDAMFVAGFADRYRFEVRHPDGSTTAVERVIDLVPVQPAEFEWAKRNIVASFRMRAPWVFDVFAPDGRFLTTVPAPDRLRTEVWPVIDGELLLVAEEDELGNVLVKRYRLVLPGEED